MEKITELEHLTKLVKLQSRQIKNLQKKIKDLENKKPVFYNDGRLL